MNGSARAAGEASGERLREGLLALAARMGVAVDPSALRAGGDAGSIVAAARKAGVAVRLRRGSWNALAATLPALVLLADGSCLIVTAIEAQDGTPVATVEAPDGALRPVALDRRRFETGWTGEWVTLDAGRSAEGWRLSRRGLAHLLAEEPRLLLDLAGITVGLAMLAPVPALFAQLALARVLPQHADKTFALALAGLAVVLAIEVALRALAAACTGRLGGRLGARLSVRVVDRLLALPPGVVDAHPPGEVRQRILFFETTHRALLAAMPRALLDGAVAVVALPLLFVLDWPVGALAVTLVGLGVIEVQRMVRRLRRKAAAQAAAERHRDGVLLGWIASARLGRTLGLDDERLAAWEDLSGEAEARRGETGRVADRLAAAAWPLSTLALLGALALGVALPALSGTPTAIASLLAATLLLQRMLAPLPRLPGLLMSWAQAGVARRDLAALVNHPSEPVGQRADLAGSIAFEHVGVRYPGAKQPALDDISFAMEPGTTLGIFGPSGAGKSTVARLMGRTVTQTQGVVRLDGRDARGLDPAAVRRQVAVLSGRSTLFAGPVRETLTAGRPGATFEEMTAAVRVARADEVIERLPRGYETVLATGAPTLSSGQRQRLALARALISRPRILVLDEALSALDLETEEAVLTRMRQACAGMTLVLISHRVATLAGADHVLVLEAGRLADQGSPADLAERNPLFRDATLREAGPPDEEEQRWAGLLAPG